MVDAAQPAPAPAPAPCTLANDTTIDDGQGTKKPDGYAALGDVRIYADDASTAVTWTRTDHYDQGDQGEVAKLAQRRGTGAFSQVAYPDYASACSIYGQASPNSAAYPFVVWGAMNHYAFEAFATLPKQLAGPEE